MNVNTNYSINTRPQANPAFGKLVIGETHNQAMRSFKTAVKKFKTPEERSEVRNLFRVLINKAAPSEDFKLHIGGSNNDLFDIKLEYLPPRGASDKQEIIYPVKITSGYNLKHFLKEFLKNVDYIETDVANAARRVEAGFDVPSAANASLIHGRYRPEPTS